MDTPLIVTLQLTTAGDACDYVIASLLARPGQIVQDDQRVQLRNQGCNQDGIPYSPTIHTLCCVQQLDDMLSTLQLGEEVTLYAQHTRTP